MSILDPIVSQLRQASSTPAFMEKHDVSIEVIVGDTPVAKVVVDANVELPIFLSVAEEQLLCITYLFRDDEVKPESRCEMMEAMLDMNVPMPLSDFGKIKQHYVVFGALSSHSSAEVILEEVLALQENAIEALEAMSVFLK